MSIVKLTDPAKDLEPILDADGNVNQAKTEQARRDARKATKGWTRESTHPGQEARRQDRIDTAYASMGGSV